MPKSNYKSGKYKLVRQIECSIMDDKFHYSEEIIYLTSNEAKTLFKLYKKLGFCEIQWIGN